MKEQDFLFLMEEGYAQEEGEWQVNLSVGYFDHLVQEEDEEEETKDMWRRSVKSLAALATRAEAG